MPTTAATARPYRRLTAVPNTGLTVPANAKPNTTTTAATGLRSFPPVRQTRPVLTSLTALPKSVPGTVTTGMLSPVMSALPKRKALVRITDILRRSLWERSVRPDGSPNCQHSAIRTIASNARRT